MMYYAGLDFGMRIDRGYGFCKSLQVIDTGNQYIGYIAVED